MEICLEESGRWDLLEGETLLEDAQL
jgi:hypothetical protein